MTCFIKAQQTQIPYKGLVNFNHVPTKVGLVIQYKCFTCDTEFELEVNWFNPNQQPPKNKEDFKKKMGMKDKVII